MPCTKLSNLLKIPNNNFSSINDMTDNKIFFPQDFSYKLYLDWT